MRQTSNLRQGIVMDIQCRHCNQKNPAGSLYCNKCGQDLNNGNPASEEYISEKINNLIQKKCDEFNEEATEVKFKTLASLEEKATTWAKRQLAALTFAISILIAVLSYVGFSGLDFNKKYNELFEGAKKEITSHKKNIRTTTANFNEHAEEINTKLKEIDDKSQKTVKLLDEKMAIIVGFNSEKIDKYTEELQSTLKEVNELNSKYKILKNNRFKIQVHYRDNDQNIWHKNVNYLQNKLDNKGFILSKRQVSNVRADRQEIIIYSESRRKAALDIKDLITDEFTFFDIKTEVSVPNNDFDIIIKLCAQSGNLPGDECKQPKK